MNVLRARCRLALLLLALMSGPALAATRRTGRPNCCSSSQIVVLILVGRLLGEAMLRMKQPAVMGQLIAGLLLGPSVLGALFPDVQHALFPAAKEQKAMIDAVAQFGILMLLLLTGMETDLKLVRQTGRAAVSRLAHRHRGAVHLRRRAGLKRCPKPCCPTPASG